MLDWLDWLQDSGAVGELDVHFARLMVRLDGRAVPELAVAAALASHASANGHVCADLHNFAEREIVAKGYGASGRFPAFGEWVARLSDSTVVGAPGDYRPLVLDEDGRLYLYRYWDYESRLAENLCQRAREDIPDVDEMRLRDGLKRLFPVGTDTAPNWQQVAAAIAVLRRLCIVSGGPGTGKTTTLVRVLALLLEQTQEVWPRIALAAPTGKAAARMQEAIHEAVPGLDVTTRVGAEIPRHASTVHRLLGARPGRQNRFRYHRDNPMPFDVLVVDEASMVDLALMTKLVEALPLQSRLILLGDKDQLASVEAGAVLGDLCVGGEAFSECFSVRLKDVTGQTLSLPRAPRSGLADSVVWLKRNYRFAEDSGVGWLSRVVRSGDDSAATKAMEDGVAGPLVWHEVLSSAHLRERLVQVVSKEWRDYWELVEARAPASMILAAANRFRILVALRQGPFGTSRINEMIEELLRSRHLIRGGAPWYPGRLVMVTENDYQKKLYNGDLGIALPDPDMEGNLRVFFEDPQYGVRAFSPLRMPRHETVFAMTVHKSQGSEFERVALVLPPEDSPVLSRELVYTGITRARERAEVWGGAEVLRSAIRRTVGRTSGLTKRLGN